MVGIFDNEQKRIISICNIEADGWDYYISRAEIAYNTGRINDALYDAKLAEKHADTKARKTAIGIFIAKCYSALHKYEESSKIYRELIKEDAYIPPMIIGMMYNNLTQAAKPNMSNTTKKVRNNITLIKIFSGDDECE